jgi:hypothetical protein
LRPTAIALSLATVALFPGCSFGDRHDWRTESQLRRVGATLVSTSQVRIEAAHPTFAAVKKAVYEQTGVHLVATPKSVSIDGEDFSPTDWNRTLAAKDETVIDVPAGTFALGYLVDKSRDAMKSAAADTRVNSVEIHWSWDCREVALQPWVHVEFERLHSDPEDRW